MAKAHASLIIYLALAACGPAGNDSGPGGVSTEDARALDEAAAKLDAKPESQSEKAAAQQ